MPPCSTLGTAQKPLSRWCAQLLFHNIQTNGAKAIEFRMIFCVWKLIKKLAQDFSQLGSSIELWSWALHQPKYYWDEWPYRRLNILRSLGSTAQGPISKQIHTKEIISMCIISMPQLLHPHPGGSQAFLYESGVMETSVVWLFGFFC